MEHVDCVVIGAGVVGLAIGRALAKAGHETLVLEREAAVGAGISSRNSEVIHAGLYYAAGSLKARLCARGRELLYAYCTDRGVAHRRTGKLVVATEAAQLPALKQLAEWAETLRAPALQWLDRAQAQALEPALHCEAALLSPLTGIVDSHGLMLSLQGELEQASGMVVLRSEVEAQRQVAGQWVLEVRDGEGGETEIGA
ncbi:MAG: FAD-dependent oxidoreductase, partial [Paucibacter sp.]|nr:FAD-dependent oxidoreductase [Roseateles sp.]